MKIFLTRYLLLVLVIGLSACSSTAELSRLGDRKSTEERRLLVTFVDRTINRDLSVNAQDGYRIRGQYGNSGWSKRIAVDLADRYHIQFVAQWPVTTLGVSCVVYEVPEALPLQQVISDLQQDHDVASVQLMQKFKVLTDKPDQSRSYSDPYLKLQTGFQSLGVAELHKIATGRGVKIALIDTGVDTDHPDLKGQIEFSQDFAPEPARVGMADVHGTAVAGILSARPNNGIGIAGIAPDADIMALRACWPDKPGSLTASCNSFTLALALNTAIRMDSQIINLSLSGPEDPLLRLLVEKALQEGITVIAAVPAQNQSGGFPANVSGVIAVGQGVESKNGQIIAPGQDILTTVPQQGYDFMTGSSFATPHVVGIAALLLQVHPDWLSADIKRLLESHNFLASNNLLDLVKPYSSTKNQ